MLVQAVSRNVCSGSDSGGFMEVHVPNVKPPRMRKVITSGRVPDDYVGRQQWTPAKTTLAHSRGCDLKLLTSGPG
jgi:hypothetical protein